MGRIAPNTLPEQPNILLGRDLELKAAREQLLSIDVRLLSLTGPPGVGKTRLAIAVAEGTQKAFPDGVWFVDLAQLHDPALVGPEIASTLGIAEYRDDSALDSLAAYLRDCQALLILDNFEGVLLAAKWISQLLERTPGVKILTTSRERLRLRWERTIPLLPLPLPNLDPLPDLPTLAENPSVALFFERATAANANFTLSTENAPVIAALCNHLDGLPLAIELAAARASVLSPAEILANMDDRFRLLGRGPLDLPKRHQTLKAAIDWSYESLPPSERKFLSRLSVFTGGFSLAAAEVVGESNALGLDGLDRLIDLVEKSLVIKDPNPAHETRFTFFESIRAYLLDRLGANGELDATRRQHARYYLELAERNYSEMKSAHQRAWIALLETEHDNLRSAMQWALETGEYPFGRRIAAALWIPFWWLQGHVREGLRWLETFQPRTGEIQDETSLRILEGIGMMRGWQGEYEPGKALLLKALLAAEQKEDAEAIARILAYLGWVFWVNGKIEQVTWLAEKMKALSLDVDPWELAYAFLSLGTLQYEAGLDQAAEISMTRSLDYFRFTEEKQQGVIFASHRLSLLRYRKGKHQEANEGMMAALEAARQLDDLHVIAFCVDDAAQLVAQQMAEHDVDTAQIQAQLAQVLGAVDHWRETLSLMRTPREKEAYQRTTENLRSRMGEMDYLPVWQEGRSLPRENVIQMAIDLLKATYQLDAKDGQLTGEGMPAPLSERERQVISLVAQGLSNQEIARQLFITERTVRFHITSIFNKLGANNRAQAVAIANRLGTL